MGNMLSDNLGGNNTESRDAIAAAYCAGDQNKFWEYQDILFANQTGENVGNYTSRRLIAYAQTIGLNMNDFKSCFNGGKYLDRVAQDPIDGKKAGIQSTPSFIVNGKIIEGAQPFEVFQQAIESALAGK
jgi:protein-disulfide isomerase